ncbi:MAG: cell division protein ZapA [Pseudothermotoga sp.]
MTKSITIRLGERTYDLTTDATEEELVNILNQIQTQYSQIKNTVQDAQTDEILVVMLANALLDKLRYERAVSRMISKFGESASKKAVK